MPRPLFQYACIATDGSGGRCRENAIIMDGVPSFFCREHMAEGAEVKLPPFADVVDAKFTLWRGGALHKRLLAAGFAESYSDANQSEQYWRNFAAAVGRDAYAIRALQADAGVAVFGGGREGGLADTDAIGLRKELERVVIPTSAGDKHYNITGLEMRNRSDKPNLPVAIVHFGLVMPKIELTTEQEKLVNELFAYTWPKLYVYVNPPDSSKAGLVLHTANFAGKPSNNPSTFSIKFFVEGQFAGSWYPEVK